jgi:hypothetical protein
MKDIIIKGKIFIRLIETRLLISIISPNKLIDGGAAILQMHNRNHQIAIEGITCIRPLLTTKLREEIRSNAILVKQNIPEEHRPWAIIRTKHPEVPLREPTMMPPITNLMWATDE